MLGVLLIAPWVSVILAVGCRKKKNEAEKLKPRNLDKPNSNLAPAPGAPPPPGNVPAVPVEKQTSKMVPREADDNETINDAKSDWGVVK